MEALEAPEAGRFRNNDARAGLLFAGPTGAGKSTLLASMIEYINQHRVEHIVTLEDPIEFVYESKKSRDSTRA